jgi:dCTP deaminase
MNPGALADHQITQLIEQGVLKSTVNLAKYVQPATLDLPLKTGKVYEVACMPSLGSTFLVHEFIEAYTLQEVPFTASGTILGQNRVYLAEVDLEVAFSKDMFAPANPKSSSGRIDLHCILVVDGAASFNTIPAGHKGSVWMIIVPQSFPVKAYPDETLMQIMVIEGENQIVTGKRWLELQEKEHIIIGPGIYNEPVLHLSLEGVPCNAVAHRTGKPVDLKARKSLPANAYFREKQKDERGMLFLEPGEFLIAATIERMQIPANMAAVMVPFDDRLGELRSHYAGFFDPGLGVGFDGAACVLEIRNVGSVPAALMHGQPICRFIFETLSSPAEHPYGQTKAAEPTNYQGQVGVRLGKYFTRE